MEHLKSRVAATSAGGNGPASSPSGAQSRPQVAQAGASSQVASSSGRAPSAAAAAARPAPASAPAAAPPIVQHTASFQGIPLYLGEPGSPLQSMAVLTHTSPRQMEEYAAGGGAAAAPGTSGGLLASDARFLASLQRMADTPRSRAAAIMQMSAGAMPAPALLVWAAQEVVGQTQALLKERLAAGGGAAALLRAEPWYAAALQLAQAALASRSQPPQPAPTTELELLKAFALGADSSGSYVSWEQLWQLPQLSELLAAAAGRSAKLAATLDVAGFAPAAISGVEVAAGQQQWLLPQLRSAAAEARAKAVAALAPQLAGDAPLNADEALAAAAASGAVDASEWLAAASLLRNAEVELGCAPSTSTSGAAAASAGALAVPVLHLLGLPRQPPQLGGMKDLQVTAEEVGAWIKAAATSPGSVPAALQSRLAAARKQLAAAGRALAALSSTSAATTGEAAATAAWLRAVGGPLASGLLAGGYGSLRPLRSMPAELREALLLRLLEAAPGTQPGAVTTTSSGGITRAVGGGARALAAAAYSDAEAAWLAAKASASGAADAVRLLEEEAVSADLDLTRERFIPPAPKLAEPPTLPSAEELAAAVRALPAAARLLHDSVYALQPAGWETAAGVASSEAAAAQAKVLEALAAAGEGAAAAAAGAAGRGELSAWLADSRRGLLSLPLPLLSLLLRFLRVQVTATPEGAQSQRNKLLALMSLVAEQQQRAAAAAPTAAGEELPREVVALALSGALTSEGLVGSGSEGAPAAALAAVLGPDGSRDFGSWLEALVRTSDLADRELSTAELAAQTQLAADVERYLQMTHDPRLQLLATSPLAASAPAATSTSVPSSSFSDPALRAQADPGRWLEGARPELDAYLQAMGYRALGDAEWAVYRDAALEEWEAGRPAREEQLAAAGHSGFHNPRADEVYLQQLLERSIPEDAPLGPQSRRYLDTLIRNPTWTFAQRLQAVQRLIQLNDHFASQPPPTSEGSPFAAYFAAGGPDPVPKLGPLGGAAGAAAALEAGKGGKKGAAKVGPAASGGTTGGVTKVALQIPDGF